MIRWIIIASALIAPSPSFSQPFHDQIPTTFQGTFAPSISECKAEYGVEVIEVKADGIHYYEGDDYLLIGVSFDGASTKSEEFIPLFNGRFTGRSETRILGEVTARMEMENPNTLIRYTMNSDGEANPKPVNIWVRCPK